MDILTQLCSWWWLAWLLPFLLGLLLGWLLWAKYKKMKEDLEDEVAKLKAQLKELEDELAKCRSHNSDLDGQISLLKGRLREIQYEKELWEKQSKSSAVSKSAVASIAAGSTVSAVSTPAEKKEKPAGKKAKTATKKEKPAAKKSKAKTKKNTKKTSSTKSAAKTVAAASLAAGAKRGRPKKEDSASKATTKTAAKSEVKAKATTTEAPKARRGRPKGSTNKTKPATKPATKTVAKPAAKAGTTRRPGRPKGSTTKSAAKTTTTRRPGRPKGSTTTPKKAVPVKAKTATAKAKVTPVKTRAAAKPKKTVYSNLKSDNLQVIEGIGPKMEEVLKNSNIKTWRGLASKTPAQLSAILKKAGGSYGVINPKDWPRQAKLASGGRWTRLINLQKDLDGGKGIKGETDAKVEKMLIKMGLLKKHKKDDLKAIEGVGPKIEDLLKKAGFDTWEKLSKANVTALRKVLSGAGARYSLADPGTWAKQAGLAAKAKWDELSSLQDALDGGKKK
jgi:predicted flap endonuclease-1-like 5' DNA nuclease